MPNWTDYTKKQQPSDNDLMMIEDVDANANKRLEFSGLADWIVEKLKKNNVISGALKFKGSSAYASLPTNPEQNDYYYSPDGNGTDGAGYYAWNGTAWIFIGNNDKGVDSTFTVEGAAADSKAVGDKFAKVDSETASLKEDLSNKITKFYASNQGEIHITDSDSGKVQDLMVYGKSEQKKYQGYQLLEHNTTEYNFTATTSYHELVNNAFENIKSGTYYLRKLEDAPTVLITFLSKSKEIVKKEYLTDKSEKRIVFETDVAYVKYIIQNLTVGTDYKGTVKLILASTSGADYEPYVGGISSPNPDYPQEIKSVANPTVDVRGKNLLNPLSIKKGQISIDDGKTINEQANYYHSDYIPMIGTSLSLFYKDYVIWFLYDKNKNFISSNSINAIGGKTVTISECNYIRIHVSGIKVPDNLMIAYGTDASFEPYRGQTVTLPYTLNAIPVSSGGNVTIDGRQYIADYVDVERGKLVRMCKEVEYNGDESWELQSVNANNIANFRLNGVMALELKGLSNKLLLQKTIIANTDSEGFYINNVFQLFIRISKNRNISTVAEFKSFLSKNPIRVLLAFTTPEEIDLTPEEIAALKALATYYPVTNISVNSEQLDGYTVFNYPISMQNGWNYVKQQIGDTRDYIYDMDARTQDTDLQAAEAYVNSEYAVALTELEV